MRDLSWPPTEKDLRRLYCERKLSAARIAEAYGLKYSNPKSGETLVLYHLRKFRIARRDRTEHVKRVTPGMVDEWAKRYLSGQSLKQIAGGEVSAVTVWAHLKKRGVPLRDKVDAQIAAVTKHVRRPFSGTRMDQAYLIGFARGDLNVSIHGRAVRVKTATTHPLMAGLFRSLFGEHGLVRVTPRHSSLTGYEWSLQVDLDSSYSFLLDYRRMIPGWALQGRHFWYFVAGFFDAEGSIRYSASAGYGFQVSFTNSDKSLLERISDILRRRHLHPYLRFDSHSRVWKIELWRKAEVESLLNLMPLRHSERADKAHLVLRFGHRGRDDGGRSAIEAWKAKVVEIREGRDAFVARAKAQLEGKS